MRGAAGVLGACLLSERSHWSAHKLQKSLEMGNLGLTVQQRGVQGECRGRVRGEGCGRSAGGHVSRVNEAREEGFREWYMGGSPKLPISTGLWLAEPTRRTNPREVSQTLPFQQELHGITLHYTGEPTTTRWYTDGSKRQGRAGGGIYNGNCRAAFRVHGPQQVY